MTDIINNAPEAQKVRSNRRLVWIFSPLDHGRIHYIQVLLRFSGSVKNGYFLSRVCVRRRLTMCMRNRTRSRNWLTYGSVEALSQLL